MRLLIVEDNTNICSFLKKSFEAECFAVDVAHDGDEGMRLARVNQYDAIVLDNVLPNKTGFEMCSELRACGTTTPILMLSVQAEKTDIVRTLHTGADDYLTKPFSFDELNARVHALLRRPATVQGDVLTAHGITLDTRKHVVQRGGQEILLTRKEFMLLEYLMRNIGTVVTRAMLLEHVWDMYADPFSNTIESHVLSIRKKLSKQDGDRVIETVPGRGYRIA